MDNNPFNYEEYIEKYGNSNQKYGAVDAYSNTNSIVIANGLPEEFKNLCSFCKKILSAYIEEDDERMKRVAKEEIERLASKV